MLSNTVGHPGKLKRVAEDVEESLQVDESGDERQSDGLAGRQNPHSKQFGQFFISCLAI